MAKQPPPGQEQYAPQQAKERAAERSKEQALDRPAGRGYSRSPSDNRGGGAMTRHGARGRLFAVLAAVVLAVVQAGCLRHAADGGCKT